MLGNGSIPGETLNVRDNTIVGLGGNAATAPNDTLSYPFRVSAIHFEGHSSGTAVHNSVTNANIGILARTASSVTGSGNTLDQTQLAIVINDAGSQATLLGNDLTRYSRSIQQSNNSTSNLTCNWWGTATGAPIPGSFTTTQGAPLFTPFATGRSRQLG